MKQKFIVPKEVSKNVQIKFDRNGDSSLIGFITIDNELKPWMFKLPGGTWYISEQNFLTGEIILWNGLKDVQDKYEYIVEEWNKFGNNNIHLQTYLNQKFEEGLELISCFEFKLIFKRKI